MEDDKIDDGIVGSSEVNDLMQELNEKNELIEKLQEQLKTLQDDYDNLADDYDFVQRDLEDAEETIEELQSEYDRDEIKSDVMVDVARRLTIDGLLTPQLEEWIENYCRFYLGEV